MIADYDALLERVAESQGGIRGIPDFGLPLLFLGLEAIINRWDWLQANGQPLTDGQWDTLDDWINKTMESLYATALIGFMQPSPRLITSDMLLYCDGAIYQKSDYPELYQFYDGTSLAFSSSQFRVPDMRQALPRDFGNVTASDFYYGDDDVTLTEGNLPPHKHERNDRAPGTDFMTIPGGGTIPSGLFVGNIDFQAGTARTYIQEFTGSVGQGQPFTIVPRSYQVYWYVVAR